jgi:hypothetical protein
VQRGEAGGAEEIHQPKVDDEMRRTRDVALDVEGEFAAVRCVDLTLYDNGDRGRWLAMRGEHPTVVDLAPAD